MPERLAAAPVVAIVDYGMGNLYSVQQACRHVGLASLVTDVPAVVRTADAVILPGIGAMPDAMRVLRETGLDDALRAVAEEGRPLFGICLGMQLLMSEGTEFGRHKGLDIVPGEVLRFEAPVEDGQVLKVPSIGWNAVFPTPQPGGADPWAGTLLAGVPPGEPFYFVHSYRVVPGDPAAAVATTRYGDVEYCSALRRGSVFGCQFHPERSGPTGLRMYSNLAELLLGSTNR